MNEEQQSSACGVVPEGNDSVGGKPGGFEWKIFSGDHHGAYFPGSLRQFYD